MSVPVQVQSDNPPTPRILPLATLKAWGACADAQQTIKRLYPEGIPLTLEAARTLREHGVDVLWGAVRLLTDGQRVKFIVFTLRQRQPHLVKLLRDANFPEHADAVAALSFATPEDAATVQGVLSSAGAAAWDAAWDAAQDEQLTWIADRLAEART